MNLDKTKINQAIYDLSTILNNLNSIEKTTEKMKGYKGKPFYNGCEEAIKNWIKSNEECKKSLLPSLEHIIHSIK